MSPVTTTALIFLVAPLVFGAPALDSSSLKKNGADAQQLNLQFASLKATDPCDGTDMACVEGSFAQCVSGKWALTDCAGGTKCFVLPLLNKAGTSITCDQQADAEARISNTGVSGGLTGAGSSSIAAVDASGSNSTSDDMNGTNSDGGRNSTGADAGRSTYGTDDVSSDCNEEATVTVTVTNSVASSVASRTFAASATLAPGFTLPPSSGANATATVSGANVTATSSGAFPATTGTLPLNSTETSAIPTGTFNTTQTLSPASASAFLSSLSAASPGISISTLSASSAASSAAITSASQAASSASPTKAVVATSGSAGAVSLSLFTTTPTGSPTGSPASLAAVPTAGGYGYRVRRVARGF